MSAKLNVGLLERARQLFLGSCLILGLMMPAFADHGGGGGRSGGYSRSGGIYYGRPGGVGIGIGIGIGGFGTPYGIGYSNFGYSGLGYPYYGYSMYGYRSAYPGYSNYGYSNYGYSNYDYYASRPVYGYSSPRSMSYPIYPHYSNQGYSYGRVLPSQSVKLNPDGTPAGELRPGMVLPDGAIVISVGPTTPVPVPAPPPPQLPATPDSLPPATPDEAVAPSVRQ